MKGPIKNEITFYILSNIDNKFSEDPEQIEYKLLCLVNKSQEIGGIMFQIYVSSFRSKTLVTPEFMTQRILKIFKNFNNKGSSEDFFLVLNNKLYGKI